jgi:hypothetical protein
MSDSQDSRGGGSVAPGSLSPSLSHVSVVGPSPTVDLLAEDPVVCLKRLVLTPRTFSTSMRWIKRPLSVRNYRRRVVLLGNRSKVDDQRVGSYSFIGFSA